MRARKSSISGTEKTAFSMPMAAYASSVEHDHSFPPIFRFLIVPMFLFSGTFFPISNLPAAIQPIAWLSPLWHGVELSRGLALGTIALHVATF